MDQDMWQALCPRRNDVRHLQYQSFHIETRYHRTFPPLSGSHISSPPLMSTPRAPSGCAAKAFPKGVLMPRSLARVLVPQWYTPSAFQFPESETQYYHDHAPPRHHSAKHQCLTLQFPSLDKLQATPGCFLELWGEVDGFDLGRFHTDDQADRHTVIGFNLECSILHR